MPLAVLVTQLSQLVDKYKRSSTAFSNRSMMRSVPGDFILAQLNLIGNLLKLILAVLLLQKYQKLETRTGLITSHLRILNIPRKPDKVFTLVPTRGRHSTHSCAARKRTTTNQLHRQAGSDAYWNWRGRRDCRAQLDQQLPADL